MPLTLISSCATVLTSIYIRLNEAVIVDVRRSALVVIDRAICTDQQIVSYGYASGVGVMGLALDGHLLTLSFADVSELATF